MDILKGRISDARGEIINKEYNIATSTWCILGYANAIVKLFNVYMLNGKMEFSKKLDSLIQNKKSEPNQFLKEGMKVSSETTSCNGAKKYSTSGDPFVDNFAAISYFKEPRSYKEVSKDMEYLWSIDPLMCLKLSVYIRLITRKTVIVHDDGKKEELETQKGQGLKHEGLMRMLWLAIHQPETFKVNIAHFIAAGSWKDIFKMLSLDLQYHGWDNRQLDWNFMLLTIKAGLLNSESSNLVRKYLPTIRTNKNCNTLESQSYTLIGRWLAKKFSPGSEKETSYKIYRKIKSEGTAHQWQQLISKQLYSVLNFDSISGRALSLLVNSKFLENHNLEEKYSKWIMSKPVAKYTGFVFELFKPLGSGYNCRHIEDYKEATINAQFAQLVNTGKSNTNTNSSLLVVRDTSCSMAVLAKGCNVSAYDIGKSMALYFSEFLEGPFANSFAEFADSCVLHQWVGSTPVDKYINDKCEAYGGTNFQSVIDLFITLKEKGVEEKDFPSGLLLVSDGELNPSNISIKDRRKGISIGNDSTNFQTAIERLKEAGFSDRYVSNFKIIMWDIPNNYYGENQAVKFEDFADAPNFFYLSGYDPSAVSFILGNDYSKPAPRNAQELFLAAMDQELLNKLKVVQNK